LAEAIPDGTDDDVEGGDDDHEDEGGDEDNDAALNLSQQQRLQRLAEASGRSESEILELRNGGEKDGEGKRGWGVIGNFKAESDRKRSRSPSVATHRLETILRREADAGIRV
jgi:hypothetical protein